MLLFLIACGGNRPPLPHALAPPPDSPNCVHSQAPPEDEVHAIEPLRFEGEPAAAWSRLDEVVMAMPRVERVVDEPSYRQYVFTTALMRFKDDVQFELHDQVIHFRSASRIGKSDLGVNRRRMEEIRSAFEKR